MDEGGTLQLKLESEEQDLPPFIMTLSPGRLPTATRVQLMAKLLPPLAQLGATLLSQRHPSVHNVQDIHHLNKLMRMALTHPPTEKSVSKKEHLVWKRTLSRLFWRVKQALLYRESLGPPLERVWAGVITARHKGE